VRLTSGLKWLIIAIETACLGSLAAWILWRIDRLAEPEAVAGALAIIAAGDILTALLMQRFAPTRITVEPGESARAIATVLSGFDDSERGRVQVRGETWMARSTTPLRLAPGTRVRVLGRSGLTLDIDPAA
jgi:membrane protein implicated in regulation of membrane protease activity